MSTRTVAAQAARIALNHVCLSLGGYGQALARINGTGGRRSGPVSPEQGHSMPAPSMGATVDFTTVLRS